VLETKEDPMEGVRRLLIVLGCLAVVAALAPAPAEAVPVTLELTDQGVPLPAAQVQVFLSYTLMTGITDVDGRVSFDLAPGAGYWLGVNENRVNQFFLVDNGSYSVDLAVVGFMTWPGR
jgi:hypothetical protein